MELELKGKIAMVTGNSKGIGEAITKELEREGVYVFGISRSKGYDLMTRKGLNKVFKSLKDADILVNNVGGIGSNPKEWDLAIKKNYKIMVRMIEKYLEKKRRWGRVITISSIYGKEKGHNPGFTAAKSAQIAFMKCLAGKYKGITFNTICPGHINVGKPFPDKPKIIGKPEDVAGIVVFLCSDKAKYINGACITVDGGATHSF